MRHLFSTNCEIKNNWNQSVPHILYRSWHYRLHYYVSAILQSLSQLLTVYRSMAHALSFHCKNESKESQICLQKSQWHNIVNDIYWVTWRINLWYFIHEKLRYFHPASSVCGSYLSLQLPNEMARPSYYRLGQEGLRYQWAIWLC